MKYFRDYGDLTGNSVVTDLYNKIAKNKRKKKKYNPDNWKKLRHSNKGKRSINKKLVRENEMLHKIQKGG